MTTQSMNAQQANSSGERGLLLLVRREGDTCAVRRVMPTDGPPSTGIVRPTRLTMGGFRNFPVGTADFLVALYDDRRDLLEGYVFGWPARGLSHCDEMNEKAPPDGLIGGPMVPQVDDRLLHIPIPGVARYMGLFESRVEDPNASSIPPPIPDRPRARTLQVLEDGTRQLSTDLLAFYPLGDKGPLRPPDELASPVSGSRARIELKRTRSYFDLPPSGWFTSTRARAPGAIGANGCVERIERAHYSGLPQERLNICILGDGFPRDGEDGQQLFVSRAWELVAHILGTEPFSDYEGMINIYLVHAVSKDSWMTNHPDAATRRTIFNVEGTFDGGGSYYETRSPELVYEAVEMAVPVRFVHLIIVIVNCPTQWGGRAFPYQRMAFTTLGQDEDKWRFLDVAVHEAGHVLGGLADEYISGLIRADDPDPRPYPNLALAEEVLRQRVGWRHLAEAGELDSRGDFLAQHHFGDPVSGGPYYDPVIKPPANPGMLGVFWGCQYIDGSPSPAGSQLLSSDYPDPRGRYYYRPMATCKMRRSSSPFCRVCERVLTQRIIDAAT